ncbi:hypothetical protein ACJ4V0_21090 [Phreatobacter sp. HK31-P]
MTATAQRFLICNMMPDPKNETKLDGFLLTHRIFTGLLVAVYLVQFFTGCVQSVPSADSEGAQAGWFIGNAIAFAMYGLLYLLAVKILKAVERSVRGKSH